MLTKIISIICIIAVLNYIGCSSKEVMTKNTFIRTYKFSNNNNSNDIYVNTFNDDQYFFQSGHYTFETDSLSSNGKKILPAKEENFEGKIAFADIVTVEQETADTGDTVLLVVGILAAAAIIVTAIAAASFNSSAHSCFQGISKTTL